MVSHQISIAKKMYRIVLVIVLFSIPSTFIVCQVDSLSYKRYIQNILQFHPIAKNAELNIDKAEAQYSIANGLFDPKLNVDYDDKYFDEKQYFQIFRSNLELPSYLGLTFNAGYENTRGIYLNPENNTPLDGLGYLGIEANLLQGLLIDERRAASD